MVQWCEHVLERKKDNITVLLISSYFQNLVCLWFELTLDLYNMEISMTNFNETYIRVTKIKLAIQYCILRYFCSIPSQYLKIIISDELLKDSKDTVLRKIQQKHIPIGSI